MNLDYLRLFLASVVMFNHTGVPLPGMHNAIIHSEIAVLCFFVISGFLITQSYMNSSSLESYTKKRIARIYPPIVCVVLALSVVGLLTHAGQPYYRGLAGLMIFQHWLALMPSGFTHGILNGIYIHGAFWTLVIEVQFYFFLPFIVTGLRKREKTTLAILAVIYLSGFFIKGAPRIDGPLLEYVYIINIFNNAHFFIAGVLTAFYFPKIAEKKFFFPLLVPLAICIYYILAYRGHPILNHLLPFSLMIIVLAIAKICIVFGKRSFFGDLSYGVYLYHFPVATAVERLGFEASAIDRAIITFGLSFLSWHLVEKTAIHGIYQNKILNWLIFNPWIALKRKIALYMHVPNFRFKYGAN